MFVHSYVNLSFKNKILACPLEHLCVKQDFDTSMNMRIKYL